MNQLLPVYQSCVSKYVFIKLGMFAFPTILIFVETFDITSMESRSLNSFTVHFARIVLESFNIRWPHLITNIFTFSPPNTPNRAYTGRMYPNICGSYQTCTLPIRQHRVTKRSNVGWGSLSSFRYHDRGKNDVPFGRNKRPPLWKRSWKSNLGKKLNQHLRVLLRNQSQSWLTGKSTWLAKQSKSTWITKRLKLTSGLWSKLRHWTNCCNTLVTSKVNWWTRYSFIICIYSMKSYEWFCALSHVRSHFRIG